MKEKIWEALMALAEKLGTTADKLWVILVKQNEVVIFRYHIAMWVFGVCLALFVIGLIMLCKSDWDQGSLAIAGHCITWPAAFVGICSFLYLLCELGPFTTALRNPEYNALANILDALGGGR